MEQALLCAYFNEYPHPVAGQQSYDSFVSGLSYLFEKNGSRNWSCVVEGKGTHCFTLQLSEPQLLPPPVTPEETFKQRSCYTAPLTAVLQLSRDEKLLCQKRVTVCEVPYLVQPSGRDVGGYFIIHGTERVIITQQIPGNLPWLVRYSVSKKEYYINSGRSNVKLTVKSHGPILLTKLGFRKPQDKLQLPLALLFLALGVEQPEAALRLSLIHPLPPKHSNRIKHLIQQSWESLPEGVTTPATALQRLAAVLGCKESSNAAAEYATQQLTWNCFPTYGCSFEQKAAALGMMTFQLLQCSLGLRPPHDMHHLGRMRYERVGGMLTKLLRSSLKSVLVGCSKRIDALQRRGKLKPSQLPKIEIQSLISVEYITNILCSSLGSGRILQYEGISQVFNRMNQISELSHLSAVQKVIPSQAEKVTELRSYHMQSAPGFIDAHHTPDGAKCGVILYPTLLTQYSSSHSVYRVLECVKQLLAPHFRSISDCLLPTTAPLLYVNGVWRGGLHRCSRSRALEVLRAARRSGELPRDCSLYSLPPQELHVWCDEGRLLRPLLRLPLRFEELLPLDEQPPSWTLLLDQGHIEYVCPFEAEQLCIAESMSQIKDEHTHCEVAGLALMSYGSAKVAYGNRNPACRITYFNAQGKQAVSSRLPLQSSTENQPRPLAVRGDYHELLYVQKPLAASCIDRVRGAGEEHQEGINAIVLVSSYNGYNQEDAIIFCKASHDRGMFRSFYYKGYRVEEDEAGRLRICYTSYCDQALPSPGTRLEEGDTIIGARMERDGRVRDANVVIKPGNGGIVHEATLTLLHEGKKLSTHAACVVVRSMRTPELGDKFSSRHGQKGVIGMIYNQEDMPFAADGSGMVPDIIINPHAVPTRMTAGQFVESLVALSTCFTGYSFDATPLQAELDGLTERLQEELDGCHRAIADKALQLLLDGLRKAGIQPLGNVRMCNGMTGELMEQPLFMGPVYYQRLKHMVKDKVHARARGPMNSTTRQPTDGRSKDGAQRFGEMERDCLLGSGGAQQLYDRLIENSDKYEAIICRSCGIFGTVEAAPAGGSFRCRDSRCVGQTIVKIIIPYSLKLFFDELRCMDINACLELEARPPAPSPLLYH